MNKLYQAAQSGNLKLLQRLAGRGYRLDEPNKDRWTALHFAIMGGQSDVVRFLIDRDISVNLPNRQGQSPLHFAAQVGDEFIIAMLVENGAILDAQDINGRTPLHYAASGKSKLAVKFLLDFHANPDVMDRHYVTALQLAVDMGEEEIVQLLLEGGATPDICWSERMSVRDPIVSWSALHVAAKTSNLEVMRMLLERVASCDIMNNMGVTPLHVAAEQNCQEMIDLLLESNADIMAVDKDLDTPLIVAIRARHLDNVKKLCDDMTVGMKNNKDQTPLHIAADLGFYEIVEFLIEAGANQYCIDNVGNTPLHNAVIKKHKECVRLLLDCDSDIMARNFENQSPYSLSTGEIATIMKIYLDRNSDRIRAQPMDKMPRSTKATPSRLKNKLSPSKQGSYQGEQGSPSRLSQRTPRRESGSVSVKSTKSDYVVPNDLKGLENMVRHELDRTRSSLMRHIEDVRKLIRDLRTDMQKSNE